MHHASDTQKNLLTDTIATSISIRKKKTRLINLKDLPKYTNLNI